MDVRLYSREALHCVPNGKRYILSLHAWNSGKRTSWERCETQTLRTPLQPKSHNCFFMFFPRSLSCAVALVQSIGTVQYCTVVQSTAVQTELSLLSFRPPPSTPAAPQKAFVGPVVLW